MAQLQPNGAQLLPKQMAQLQPKQMTQLHAAHASFVWDELAWTQTLVDSDE